MDKDRILPLSIASFLIATSFLAIRAALTLGAVSSFGELPVFGWVSIFLVPFPLILVWTAGVLALLKRGMRESKGTHYAIIGLAILFTAWLAPTVFVSAVSLVDGNREIVGFIYRGQAIVIGLMQAIGWWYIFLGILSLIDGQEQPSGQIGQDELLDESPAK